MEGPPEGMLEDRDGSASASRISRRRRWAFRVAALLMPFVVVALLEIGFRLTGAFAPDEWANAYVGFEEGEPYFPRWRARFKAPKPSGTYRIFVLGGSTVVGKGIPRPFPGLLQAELSRRRPDLDVEVVNAGVLAFGSHRVFQVMREAAEYEPDLFLVYTGHNEFLEDIFFDPEGWVARNVGQDRLSNRLRTVRAIRSVLGLDDAAEKQVLARSFQDSGIYPLIRSREQYDLRLRFLRENLRTMIEFARSRDVDLVVSPAVANLLWEPGTSVHGEACRRELCGELLARGEKHGKAGDWDPAARAFENLHAEADDGFALSHHHLGIVHLSRGEPSRALAQLTEANALDRHGNRSNRDVRAAILEVCREAGVRTIDLHDACHARILEDFHRLRNRGLFFDHCHPTPPGHAFFAAQFVEPLLSVLARRRPSVRVGGR